MRPARWSLRARFGSQLLIACAMVTVGVASGCGGSAAAPTPTTAAPTAAAAQPIASPARSALASPVPSPSLPAPTPASASSAAGPEQTYEVKAGDTLLAIAGEVYGDSTLWRKIYDANKDAIGADPDKLKLGQTLKIPPKDS